MGILVIAITMLISTLYHSYNAMERLADFLFRMDMLFIGLMIFILTLIGVYTSFYAFPIVRANVIFTMFAISLCNIIAQLTPCYTLEEYNCHRTVFYVIIIAICVGISLSWYLYIGSDEEVKLFTFRLFLSYFYLGIGFLFYLSHYPEKKFRNSKFVQLCLQSHIFWHVFVTLNSYTLHWLLYDFLLFKESLKI